MLHHLSTTAFLSITLTNITDGLALDENCSIATQKEVSPARPDPANQMAARIVPCRRPKTHAGRDVPLDVTAQSALFHKAPLQKGSLNSPLSHLENASLASPIPWQHNESKGPNQVEHLKKFAPTRASPDLRHTRQHTHHKLCMPRTFVSLNSRQTSSQSALRMPPSDQQCHDLQIATSPIEKTAGAWSCCGSDT